MEIILRGSTQTSASWPTRILALLGSLFQVALQRPTVREHGYVKQCGIPTYFMALPKHFVAIKNTVDRHDNEDARVIDNGSSASLPEYSFVNAADSVRPLAQGSLVRW